MVIYSVPTFVTLDSVLVAERLAAIMEEDRWPTWRPENYNQAPIPGVWDMAEELELLNELFEG